MCKPCKSSKNILIVGPVARRQEAALQLLGGGRVAGGAVLTRAELGYTGRRICAQTTSCLRTGTTSGRAL